MRTNYTAYSLADLQSAIYHPDVGQCVLSDEGAGKITISRAGDLSSHTTTADGYVVINKIRSVNGTVTLEIPQNSDADKYLRKWIRYVSSTATANFHRTVMTVYDPAGGILYTFNGVTPQKYPDITYDQTAGNVAYSLLVAEIIEQS